MKNLTICINTACNELDNLKLLFKSLEQNLSTLTHEVLVFIDSDNENTFEWLMTQKQVFSNLKILKNHLPIPYGYQRNINEMFLQASNEIVSYLQSDMVICKDYDLEVLKHIKPNMVLSSTRIEPPLHPSSGEKHTADFGLDPVMFDLETFTNYAQTLKKNNISNYFFAPFTLYKETWNSIGGHDTQFRRSREDSDILTRLVLNDVQIVQTWEALVYHFTCTSSRGKNWFDQNNQEAQQRAQLQQKADNIELGRFFNKWGQFQHSLEKVSKFNISAKITGQNNSYNQHFVNSIGVFFNQIETHSYFIENYTNIDNHDPANKLLNITNKDWDKYSYMFNNNIKNKFVDNVKDDVVVEIDLDKINENDINALYYLNNILKDNNDLGKFMIPNTNLILIINELKDVAHELIKTVNPLIKQEDIYNIY
jgi:hypothetical protein